MASGVASFFLLATRTFELTEVRRTADHKRRAEHKRRIGSLQLGPDDEIYCHVVQRTFVRRVGFSRPDVVRAVFSDRVKLAKLSLGFRLSLRSCTGLM